MNSTQETYTKHTPGRLVVCDEIATIQIAGVIMVQSDSFGDAEDRPADVCYLPPSEEAPHDAERLCACWNALLGIADPAAAIRAARDALHQAYRDCGGDDAERYGRAAVAATLRSALALLGKGGGA